ncbi:MAG: hypothetical protein IJT97_11325 [Bacteroidaceae bacterium]|nr:hypothetical protein [Bacteroidaceae bacterium]
MMDSVLVNESLKETIVFLQGDDCCAARGYVAFLDELISEMIGDLPLDCSASNPVLRNIVKLNAIRLCMKSFIVEPERIV